MVALSVASNRGRIIGHTAGYGIAIIRSRIPCGGQRRNRGNARAVKPLKCAVAFIVRGARAACAASCQWHVLSRHGFQGAKQRFFDTRPRRSRHKSCRSVQLGEATTQANLGTARTYSKREVSPDQLCSGQTPVVGFQIIWNLLRPFSQGCRTAPASGTTVGGLPPGRAKRWS